jgi:predicted HicB family RNase H-like nuclease
MPRTDEKQMSNFLEYKGYQGSVEVSLEDDVLHGKILRITDLVTFEAKTPDGLRRAFEQQVNEYMGFCEDEGVVPDKPFSYDEEE